MAAYKTLNSQDIIISPLEVTKGFGFENNELTSSNVNISRYLGNKFGLTESTGTNPSYFQSSIYFSTQQLYYSNYISSSTGDVQPANIAIFQPDGTIIGKIDGNGYYNYDQTNLNPQKYFLTSSYEVLTGPESPSGSTYEISTEPPTMGVMSIPKSLFGDFIMPNSLHIVTNSGSYFDDGEGRLKRDCPLITSSIYVGNVIYEHGMVILTGGTRTEGTGEFLPIPAEYGGGVTNGRTVGTSDILNFVTGSNISVSFSSSFTIYETQYKCTIRENEFNYTLNPTVISGSSNSGVLYNYATGSYFSPYVTTVGLYNGNFELLAVGKLAQPLPLSRTTDTSILLNIDKQ